MAIFQPTGTFRSGKHMINDHFKNKGRMRIPFGAESDISISLSEFMAAYKVALDFYPKAGPQFDISHTLNNQPLPKGFHTARNFSDSFLSWGTPNQLVELFKSGLIGVDPFFTNHLIPAVQYSSGNRSPVLITGDTGTGKEVIAECIHKKGVRECKKEKPFVKVNCAGIPSELLESILFGNLKGVYTGATTNRDGLVKAADKGTLFLDEIGDMSFDLQAKVLRFLNDGSFTKIGSDKEEKADVKVIAATNRDLHSMMKGREFREDLYYRINTMELNLWPLYLRPSQIPFLIYLYISRYNEKHKTDIKYVSKMLIRQALLMRWKGNVRELSSLIERSCNGVVDKEKKSLTHIEVFPFDDQNLLTPSWVLILHDEIPLEELLRINITKFLKETDKFISTTMVHVGDMEPLPKWDFEYRGEP